MANKKIKAVKSILEAYGSQCAAGEVSDNMDEAMILLKEELDQVNNVIDEILEKSSENLEK